MSLLSRIERTPPSRITQLHAPNGPTGVRCFLLAFGAATQHYLSGRSWDEVARNGGRELHVDHIRLNDRGSTVIIELAAQWPATDLERQDA
ncbi:hypothetical protein ACFQ07_30170 [Actinomadura adrarensis]|uniref:Uncharacterized protein n=1 Tax=Actinomadura adrarensis TaxID=1819600 RepID=A0ABW3CPS2_9ACTN